MRFLHTPDGSPLYLDKQLCRLQEPQVLPSLSVLRYAQFSAWPFNNNLQWVSLPAEPRAIHSLEGIFGLGSRVRVASLWDFYWGLP